VELSLEAKKKIEQSRTAALTRRFSSQLKDESWKNVLKDEFEKPYFVELIKFLDEEKKQSKVILPAETDIFNAFNYCPFDKTKVVIIGQDPYHGLGQAHGLSFSVQYGVATPPSLQNIYKELASDTALAPSFTAPNHGNLTHWATRGVLLLNAVLTVQLKTANAHQGKGWEHFTDAAIKHLSAERTGLVFLLWGKFAQAKSSLIDQQKHHVLKAGHPSPYSSHMFFGCKHFSKANQLLREAGMDPIDWRLDSAPQTNSSPQKKRTFSQV
jgi:uracil-DNA glycosylase